MSLEVLIIPALIDLGVLVHALAREHGRASVESSVAKGLELELEALRSSGCDIRSGVGQGSDVIVHTDKGYDIGIRRNEKGAYDIVTHWSSKPGKVEIQNVRADIESRIKQRYAHEKVKRELAKKGFMISDEEVQPDNTIRLVARKW